MATEVKDVAAQEFQQAEKQTLEVPALETSVNALVRSGGFDFLEAVVDGVDNLNPVRKAKRSIFLTDTGKNSSVANSRKSCKCGLIC